MQHWLVAASTRAGIRGASSLDIPADSPVADAWQIAGRTLGLTEDELVRIVAASFALAPADLTSMEPEALNALPERVARRYHVCPLRVDRRQLVLATSEPANLVAEQGIAFASGRHVRFEVAAPSAIEEALVVNYGAESSFDHLLGNVGEEIADAVRVVEELTPETVMPIEIDAAPVVKLTNLVLRDALAQGASDVHIEPGAKAGVVRFRVDGVMRPYMHLSLLALNRVVSRIKVLGKIDIADRMRPHDGRTRITVDGKPVDLRIATIPTRDTEKCVIRILRPENTRRLYEIGMSARDLACVRQLLCCRDGIVIVTGPTGSGKTTTLYSALREIATSEVNIATVEDPVEYELPGITQVHVDPRRGVTFASALRAMLRQDPDVIFVGEIRDSETAQIAAQAAMTGHLVLATLHTNDALSSVARLEDLGLDRQTIAATLRGTLAQRLIRRVCPDCAQSSLGTCTAEEEALAARYGMRPTSRALGCPRCSGSGYRGRLPVLEVAVVTPALAEMIAGGATGNTLERAAVSQGMRTLRDAALARVANGDTTLQEVQRVIGDEAVDSDEAAPSPERSVLIVNADSEWRRMVRALVERPGVRVGEAESSADACRQLDAGERFDVLLTDMSVAADNPPRDGDGELPVEPPAAKPRRTIARHLKLA